MLETIRVCKDQNVLKDYLTAHEAEVIDIMMALYDKDTYMKLHDDRKEKEGALKTLIELFRDKVISSKEAAKRANMTEAEFEAEAALLKS